MLGISVIDRGAWLRKKASWGTDVSTSLGVPMTVAELLCRYRGFDGGEEWPMVDQSGLDIEDGLVGPSQLPAVEEYMRKLPRPEECDILLLADPDASRASIENLGWCSAGYDVGYYEEGAKFSVVLNEVLFGAFVDLLPFACKLNRHLLCDSLQDAQELVAEHERLAREGVGVEAFEQAPIAVFLRDMGRRLGG